MPIVIKLIKNDLTNHKQYNKVCELLKPVALELKSITNTNILQPYWCKNTKHLQSSHIHIIHLLFLFHQVPVPCTHGGACIPEFLAPHLGGAGNAGGGSPDLEHINVLASSDQMGLSKDIWFTPFLHVKVYHGTGSVDSPWPSGSLCSGRHPRGKSPKNSLVTCAL